MAISGIPRSASRESPVGGIIVSPQLAVHGPVRIDLHITMTDGSRATVENASPKDMAFFARALEDMMVLPREAD